jgi:hypothetical protein
MLLSGWRFQGNLQDYPVEVSEQGELVKGVPPETVVFLSDILAQGWQRTLGNVDCSSPADLVRKLGLSRACVTQVLRLL